MWKPSPGGVSYCVEANNETQKSRELNHSLLRLAYLLFSLGLLVVANGVQTPQTISAWEC